MSEKIFEPSPEKLQKALIEGKTKRSQLLAGAILSFIVVLSIRQLLGIYWVRIQFLLECLWSDPQSIQGECGGAVISGAYASTFIFSLLLLMATIVINWAQVGSIWLPRSIAPDLARLSFGRGFSKIASGFTNLPTLVGKALLSTSILLLLFVFTMPVIWHLQDSYIEQQWLYSAKLMGSFSLYTTLLLIGFAFFDLFTQRKKFREQVFLDHHEMQREFKESEGDPHLRAQRRALHQAISREEMITQIKKAKVIIVERFEDSSRHDEQERA
jgi:type III secretion protein U